MDDPAPPGARSATLASEAPDSRQRLAAGALCLTAAALTAALMPLAGRAGPDMPGFFPINQAALVTAYGLSAWTLFAQFRRGRTLPLLLMASGTLYTAAIVLLQMLSIPGTLAAGRILGSGPETTTWLWTFWHAGPPACALAYVVASRPGRTAMAPGSVTGAVTLGIVAALSMAAAAAAVATLGLPWLPRQVTGDDYTALVSSGVGPAVQALTIAVLALAVFRTRAARSVLDLWICVSLVLLVFDNMLTQAGPVRQSVGWDVGRMLALASAFAILWAYLHGVDALQAKAEAAAEGVKRAEAALRQAQKLEAVGRLTGGIAHDFNNLLTVASSGFDMIRRKPEDRARVIRTAEAGLEAVERGARLTRQLLTFARRQTLHPETVNANASLMDFAPLARRAVGEAATVSFDLDPRLHPARIDRAEFEAAVLNLVVNARDAIGLGGGRISVSTRNAVRAQGCDGPGQEMVPGGSYIVVSVADDGTGMDAATLAQAFEPFFTTKEFGRGSGLGLSQVYGFARATGGTVEVTSEPGRGTIVEIWLPRAEAQVVPLTASGPASPLRRAAEGETILAVEDDSAVLAAVIENLTDLGYRVLPAHAAAEALEVLRADGRIDVLFADVVMPGGMNGVQLAVEAGRIRPGLRVLLTSGYTAEALAGEHAVPAGVPVLAKPYRREDLAERLKVARTGSG